MNQYEYERKLPFWVNFSLATMNTDELDPVYVAARNAIPILGREHVCRFLMGMSLYYDMGVACDLADRSTEDTFWDLCFEVYPTAKRGTERRYFRGDAGLTCLQYMRDNFAGPEDFFKKTYRPTYSELLKVFKDIPGYGEYHTWKIWDFYDRILGMPVASDESAFKAMPKEPVKGLKLVAAEMNWDDDLDPKIIAQYCVNTLQSMNCLASPAKDRLVHIAEVETNMCGLSHFYKGTDWVGADIQEKRKQLSGIEGHTASVMLQNLPPEVPRDYFNPPIDILQHLKVKVTQVAIEKYAVEKQKNQDMFSMFA
jgi:hypothetical protein